MANIIYYISIKIVQILLKLLELYKIIKKIIKMYKSQH